MPFHAVCPARLQGELLDLFGFSRLEFVGELLGSRAALAALSVPSKSGKLLKMLEKARLKRKQPAAAADGQQLPGAGGTAAVSWRDAQQKGPLLPRGSTGGGGGGGGGFDPDGLHLPPGTEQRDHKRYEEWMLPPTKSCPPPKPGELNEIAGAMPAWCGKVLHPIRMLNRLQSKCFESAFRSSENLLVCAPTGSGKTNVAILSVLRALALHTGHMDQVTARQRSSLFTAFPCVSLPFLAVLLRSQRTVAIRRRGTSGGRPTTWPG
eukprot:SAG22_NODE_174_length_16466_cov_34.991568_12_plen_265_part_00